MAEALFVLLGFIEGLVMFPFHFWINRRGNSFWMRGKGLPGTGLAEPEGPDDDFRPLPDAQLTEAQRRAGMKEFFRRFRKR